MRFTGTFAAFMTYRRTLGMSGKGTLHLQETAMVLEGGLPRFRVPFLGGWVLEAILAERTVRTIPYSAILRHRTIGPFRRWVRIDFRLPNGGRRYVGIRLEKPGRQNARELVDLLTQYRTVARTFEHGGR